MSAYFRVDFQSANKEDLRQVFQLTDQNGAPLDIAGATLRMGIETASGRDVLKVTTSNGRIVVIDGVAGRFDLTVPAAVMRLLPEGAYRHDLVIESAGTVRRVWTGTLTLSQGVSP
jgi:hypothetical protein